MTEPEWRASHSPEAMLHHLSDQASPRKLRLYAVSCCHRISVLLNDDRLKNAVEVARRFADGKASMVEMQAAGQTVALIARITGNPLEPTSRATYAIGGAAWAATRNSAWLAAWDAAWDSRMAARDFLSDRTDWERERLWQAGVLKDLFGNPFRSVYIHPSWLTADSPVVQLARVIYDEERYGDLPYLGDALEEAGCGDATVLEHCRSPGPHYRGCWVVDAVLGYR
jgi:hypothetical protein